MKSHQFCFHQTVIVAAGQVFFTAGMIGIFALLGRFQLSVLLGGIAGALIATANYFLLSLFANLAADRAQAQDVTGGQKLIQSSYLCRMAGLFLVLFLFAKSGMFNLPALVIPLVFTSPILAISESLRKKGGADT